MHAGRSKRPKKISMVFSWLLAERPDGANFRPLGSCSLWAFILILQN
jgi:hypothetical protein